MLNRIALALCLTLSSCTVLQVDSEGGPPRIESRGLIDSHIALGIPSESHLLHADLFDGTSSGAIAELTIWKLFHFELGLAGVSVGVGPLHIGIGLLFYEPEVPPTMFSSPTRTWKEEREELQEEAVLEPEIEDAEPEEEAA